MYYKYIGGKQKLYEYFECLCFHKWTECSDLYEKSKDYNPELMLRNFSCHEDMIAAKNALAIQQASRQGLVGIASTRGPNSSGYGAGSSKMGMKPENSYIGTKVGKSVLGIAPIALGASALYKVSTYFVNIYKYKI